MVIPLLLALAARAADDPPGITLEDAITRASSSSVAVRIAEAGVDAARARRAQATTALLPTVQAQGSLQVWDRPAEFALGGEATGEPPDCSQIPPPFDTMCSSMSEPTVVREQVTWSTTVRAVQPLTGLMAAREQLRAAAEGAEAADGGLERARATARYDAADAWYAALETDAQLQIAQSQVRALEERARSVATAVEARMSVRNDLLQVQLALAQARQAELGVLDLRELAWRRLSLATGGDGAPIRPSGAVPEPSEEPVPPEDALLAAALADRPDLDGLRAQVEAARATTRATNWERLPQLSAIGSFTHQEGQSLGTPPNSAFVGLVADWNVWGWNRVGNAAASARATARQAELQLEGAEAGVRLDVAARRRALETARASWAVAQQSVAQAEENRTLFGMRYESGAAAMIELLDAESQLVRARSEELSARYGLLRAEAALTLAAGR